LGRLAISCGQGYAQDEFATKEEEDLDEYIKCVRAQVRSTFIRILSTQTAVIFSF